MFYTFNQNNSGGDFVYRKGSISHYVIIEADSASEATDRALDIGLYFNGVDKGMDCPCCGDRWYPLWLEDATEMPTIYSQEISPEMPDDWMKWIDGPEGYIHFKDGTVTPFWA